MSLVCGPSRRRRQCAGRATTGFQLCCLPACLPSPLPTNATGAREPCHQHQQQFCEYLVGHRSAYNDKATSALAPPLPACFLVCNKCSNPPNECDRCSLIGRASPSTVTIIVLSDLCQRDTCHLKQPMCLIYCIYIVSQTSITSLKKVILKLCRSLLIVIFFHFVLQPL